MINDKDIEAALLKFKDEIQGVYLGKEDKVVDALLIAKEAAKKSISDEDLQRRISTTFLKEIIIMLKNDELDHNDFFLDALKTSEFWRPLAKLVLLKRINELKKCKILKKGKKYDVSGLKDTFFGKFIMDRLQFQRRSILGEEEYNKIKAAIKKLNYELPEEVNPTETEKFFSK